MNPDETRYVGGQAPKLGDVVRFIGTDNGLPKDKDLTVTDLKHEGVGFGGGIGSGWRRPCFRLVRRAGEAEVETVSATKPNYYRVSVKGQACDVFDLEEALGLGMKLGTALKYMTRAGDKDPSKHVEDLKKAIECLNREIASIEAKVTK